MSMSSIRLNSLTDEFPEETEALRNLERFIQELDDSTGSKPLVLTVQKLFDVVRPSSVRVLSAILGRLVDSDILEQKIRIESSVGGGTGEEFNSVTEIPKFVFDEQTGQEVEVRADRLKIIYKYHRKMPA